MKPCPSGSSRALMLGSLCLLFALVPRATGAAARDLGESFDVQKLADGVYAVIRKEPPGFAVDANNVFIIDDAGVIVVDSNGSRSSTRAVLAALRRLTDKPVRYVINTHWHDDHILGNQVYRDAFPGVEFVGHAATREYLPGKGLAARKQAFEGVPQFLAFLRDLVEKGKTPSGRDLTDEERTAFGSDLEIGGRYLAEGPTAEIVLPTITVEDRMTLYRGTRVVDIRYMGRGHTSGDLVIHLPNEGILITGDLVVWPIPLVGSDQSHVGDWSATLEKLVALHPTVVVPGHGPVMRDDSYLKLMASLFASVKQQTEAAVARGATLDEARKAVNLDEFRRQFAGDSKLRSSVFDNYVVRPAVESAWRDATGKVP